MRIQHNIMAMNAYRNLSMNNKSLNKNLEKLSSGYRINRAGDDAAGLAISEKMRAQIAGLDQAQKNAQSGINLIQTAEGALTEVHDMLNRMVTLSTQAANGTYTEQDREKIQSEIDSLTKEINRIAENSNFNGKKLLDGTLGAGTVTPNAGDAISAGQSIDNALITGVHGLTEAGNYTLEVGTLSANGTWTAGSGTTVKVAYDPDNGSGEIQNTYVDLSNLSTSFKSGIGETNNINLGKFSITTVNADVTVAADFIAELDGKDLTGVAGTPGTDGLQLQIGASAEETIKVSVESMSATSLGVGALSVADEAAANASITLINDAIEKVSTQRSNLGAYQNRLEHTINNLGVMEENIQDAESNIRDTDIADEMMAYTKNNILIQSAQAMLAQANQVPQGVLQLMG